MRGVVVLYSARCALGHRIKTDGRDWMGQPVAQASECTGAALPAQAQVAAWVRPARAVSWAELAFAGFLGRQRQIEPKIKEK